MLRISRRTDYAVRVLVSLAMHKDEGQRSMQETADEMLIPLAFVKRIVADLSRTGLLTTRRGAKGGLRLGKDPDEITLLDVVEACEEPVEISPCIDDPDFCPLSSDCPVRKRWAKLRAVMRKELSSVTIGQLARESLSSNSKASIEAISA